MCLSIAVNHPDRVLAKGDHAGFEWMVTHNGQGYRCGYVRIPVGHLWHGKGYEEIDADVHGGLTFSEPDKVCGKGGADNAWWVGFDCAHSGDGQDPMLPNGDVDEWTAMLGQHGTIRTQEYAEANCHSLCEQARVAAR